MIPIYIPLAILFIVSFLTPLIGMKFKTLRKFLVIFTLLFTFVFWIFLAPNIFSGEILTYNMSLRAPPFGINIMVDTLSIFFLILISGISFLISLIIEKFVKSRRSEFYSLFLLMIVGMTGIAMTGDIFNLFVFTEILVISSYSLTIFLRDSRSIEAGFKYLLVGAFATSLILLGITLIYGLFGTLNMADLITKVSLNKYSLIALGLLLTGFFVEIGIVPFHFWKPDVIESISLPIAATIISLSTSLGIYAILRILFVFDMLNTNYLLMIFGLISMVVGAFLAMAQSDIKRMLAYSSISQMGYIFLAFSFGFLGFTAGLFHILNNALLKVLLFLILGLVILKGGTKPVNAPVTGFCFLIASLGIAGIPPLNGFASKLLIYESGIRSGFVIPVLIAIIISVLTLAYYLKAFSKLFNFTGKKIKEDKRFLIPILFLTILCILIGLFPQLIIQILQPVVNSLLDRTSYYCVVMGC